METTYMHMTTYIYTYEVRMKCLEYRKEELFNCWCFYYKYDKCKVKFTSLKIPRKCVFILSS